MNSRNNNGMSPMEMAYKISKLENMVMKMANNTAEESASMMQMEMAKKFGEFKQQMDEMKKENEKRLKDGITKMMKAFEEMSTVVGELKEENENLKEKMNEMEDRITELTYTEQINGNQWLKYNSDLYNCKAIVKGPKLTISAADGGFFAQHFGAYGRNCVRSTLSIPSFNLKGKIKPTIAFYYELQICIKSIEGNDSIVFGFCDKHFLVDGKLGTANNSIGICQKGAIMIDGIEYGNGQKEHLKKDNVVGLGIVHRPAIQSMECFATFDGKLMGQTKLPSKFATMQLYPAISLYTMGESVRVNFKNGTWQFKDFSTVLK